MGRFASVGLNRLPTYRRLPRHAPRRRGIFFDQRLGPTDERKPPTQGWRCTAALCQIQGRQGGSVFEDSDTSVSLPEYRPLGASLVRGQWVREWRRNASPA